MLLQVLAWPVLVVACALTPRPSPVPSPPLDILVSAATVVLLILAGFLVTRVAPFRLPLVMGVAVAAVIVGSLLWHYAGTRFWAGTQHFSTGALAFRAAVGIAAGIPYSFLVLFIGMFVGLTDRDRRDRAAASRLTGGSS